MEGNRRVGVHADAKTHVSPIDWLLRKHELDDVDQGLTGMSNTDASREWHSASNNFRVSSAVNPPVVIADTRDLNLVASCGI